MAKTDLADDPLKRFIDELDAKLACDPPAPPQEFKDWFKRRMEVLKLELQKFRNKKEVENGN